MITETTPTHTRAHIRLTNQADVIKFIGLVSRSQDKFRLESKDETRRVDAASVIGVMYFTIDLNDEMYLVNETHDGLIPSWADEYRVIA